MGHLKTVLLVAGIVILAVALLLVGCKKTETKKTEKTKKTTKTSATDEPTKTTPEVTTDDIDPKSKAVVSYSSFDGGGHEFTTTIDDESIATYTSVRDYGSEDPSEIEGASYYYVVTVRAVAPGETGMSIIGDSPIMEPEEHYFQITVDEDLKITLTELDAPYNGTSQDPAGPATTDPGEDDMEPKAYPIVTIGDRSFPLGLEDNSSAEAFLEKLKEVGSLKLEMQDYGGFEKVADLPWSLPTNDETITTVPGDIILYQGNKITVYYDENTYEFTKLGHIDVTQEELMELLGSGDATVEFWLEWTE